MTMRMKSRSRWLVTTALLGGLAGGCGGGGDSPAGGAATPSPAPAPAPVTTSMSLVTCDADPHPDPSPAPGLSLAAEVTALINVVRQGPDPAAIAAAESLARHRHAGWQRQAADPTSGASDEERLILGAITVDAAVRGARESLDALYRTRAISRLGTLGTADARAELQRLSSHPDPLLRAAAGRALRAPSPP